MEELITKGELQRKKGQKLLGELLTRGERRQEFNRMVHRELERLLNQADVTTKRDLPLLEVRIAALEEKLVH
ncbi:MAG TPA: hypothetical protein GX735_06040 [Firmicutes bacterium]|nr:hypothetical protein [Bacillota bacterium]